MTNAEYKKKWALENKEHCREVLRRWYQRNKEKRKIQQATWCENNRERHHTYLKTWRLKNIEKARNYLRVSNGRRRQQIGNDKITAAEWLDVLNKYSGICAQCGSKDNIEMDHIVPLSKGGRHCKDNVQPLCLSCNRKKGTKMICYIPWKGDAVGGPSMTG